MRDPCAHLVIFFYFFFIFFILLLACFFFPFLHRPGKIPQEPPQSLLPPTLTLPPIRAPRTRGRRAHDIEHRPIVRQDRQYVPVRVELGHFGDAVACGCDVVVCCAPSGQEEGLGGAGR